MEIVTVAITRPPAVTSATLGLTVVQRERSLAVSLAAPTKAPCTMLAADEYIAMLAVPAVPFETSTRRVITAPGAR
jgi:hypothetical protein